MKLKFASTTGWSAQNDAMFYTGLAAAIAFMFAMVRSDAIAFALALVFWSLMWLCHYRMRKIENLYVLYRRARTQVARVHQLHARRMHNPLSLITLARAEGKMDVLAKLIALYDADGAAARYMDGSP
jgi:chlorite dismutase